MKLSPITAAVLSVLTANFVHANSEVTQFDEVVVTANKVEQPLSKVAGSITVINGDDLETKGTTELYDSLNKEAGVSVTGGAGRPQNITIRGMTGNRIVIVKDGIKSSDGYGASDINDKVGRNSFDLSNVKSIEVVKGASSSVHGSGAIGGVVIIETKQPEDYLKGNDFYSDVSGTYTGISNKYKGSSNLAFRSGNTESLINLSYWQGEETRNYQQDLYNRNVDGVNGAYTVNHYIGEEVMLTAKIEYYTEDMLREEGSASIQKDGIWHISTYNHKENTQDINAYIGAEYTPYDAFFEKLNSKLYWRDTTTSSDINRLMSRERNNIVEKRREIKAQSFTDQLIGFDNDFISSATLLNQVHNLAYGLSLTSNQYERPNSKSTIDWNGNNINHIQPFAPVRSYSLGIYLRDMMKINNWIITGGLRFDAHSLTPNGSDSIAGFSVKKINSSELSPSVSATYQFTDTLNAYLSYNHGYRAPAYDKAYGYNNHDFVPLTPFLIIPNMDLEAETSDSIEHGIKYDSGKTQIYGAAFYQKFENFIDVIQVGMDPSTGNYLKQYQNINGVETYGAELTLAHQFTQEWGINSKIGYVDGKDGDGEYIRTITPLEGNVGITYDLEKLSAYSSLNWASSMDRVPQCATNIGMATECATTSSWATVDLGVNYAVTTDFNISANVINLFDKEYIRYQDVAGIMDSAKGYSTEPGCYFTVNAKYVF
ncbi:TonB-dependent hemoglobin/transferrin/lactoferrin family receptor [Aliivibrio fischeri]|uniref:TonB-dependent hemoglobin/transferrin/lactoferrin family receptor n=1 Tax=Aliivibrio fischeri TaxID=668 RepID=UPI0012D8B548|nr:TonB-dependent hemoglobin/transferrin/lactoferrin family receptor [Aliivibrio fischeri]MUL03904.1 TonB-dependent hemoglobin/transferrin/lactoferrin family receptor [Aliivibrio fischeri]